MATIPQKKLRNDSGEVLRRAEAGEHFTITVSGRPVAELGPLRHRRRVRVGDLDELWRLPADATFMEDISAMGGGLADPFERPGR